MVFGSGTGEADQAEVDKLLSGQLDRELLIDDP